MVFRVMRCCLLAVHGPGWFAFGHRVGMMFRKEGVKPLRVAIDDELNKGTRHNPALRIRYFQHFLCQVLYIYGNRSYGRVAGGGYGSRSPPLHDIKRVEG